MLTLMILCFLTLLGVLAVTSVTGPEGGFTLDNYRIFLGDAFAGGILLDTIALGARARYSFWRPSPARTACI
jgi:ABC-type spermidine/putrescine transport system permease subunit I